MTQDYFLFSSHSTLRWHSNPGHDFVVWEKLQYNKNTFGDQSQGKIPSFAFEALVTPKVREEQKGSPAEEKSEAELGTQFLPPGTLLWLQSLQACTHKKYFLTSSIIFPSK